MYCPVKFTSLLLVDDGPSFVLFIFINKLGKNGFLWSGTQLWRHGLINFIAFLCWCAGIFVFTSIELYSACELVKICIYIFFL